MWECCGDKERFTGKWIAASDGCDHQRGRNSPRKTHLINFRRSNLEILLKSGGKRFAIRIAITLVRLRNVDIDNQRRRWWRLAASTRLQVCK